MSGFFEKYGQMLVTLTAIVPAFVGLVTINGNRFDALDRRFDAQERFINQRLDAQERFINQRFEAQDKLVNQRFDAQDKLVNHRFDAQDKLINQRFDAQDERLERLTDEVSELRRLMVGIGERVSRNEGEINVIREQLRIADTPSP